MSQVQEHEYVAAPATMPMDRINYAPIGEALASAASAVVGVAAACIAAAQQKVPTARFGDLMAEARYATPHEVNTKVEELLRNLRVAKPADLETAKANAVGGLAELGIACARNGQAAVLTTRVATSPGPAAAVASFKALATAVSAEHRAGYTNGTVRCIEVAMAAVGMKPIGTSTRGADTEVRAMDAQGRGLRTALLFDSEGRMSMRTKLTDFNDGSCHEVMERFYASLREQGVSFSGGTRHWRNSACLLPPVEDEQVQPIPQQNQQRQ